MKEFRTISVDTQTYDRLNRLACDNGRSIVGQIRWMLDHYVEIHELPRPIDAEPVDVVTLQESE